MTVLEASLPPLLKFLLAFGVVIVIIYIAACLFLFLRQRFFIFYPPIAIRTTPIAFNMSYQDVYLPISATSDKTNYIHGWWIPAATQEAPVWLFLHGNGSTIGDEVKRPFWFHQLGYSTFMIDYRGYGRSSGKFPTESSVYTDVEAALNYLTQARKIPAERIFVYGHSLGGAIAIDLALRYPEIAGLVVEGTFTSMRLMVNHLYSHFLIFPVDLLLNQRFDSLNKVRSLQMPILFIHGTADRLVPAHMSQTLFEAAPEPKQLLLVQEAGHHNVGELGGVQYLEAIRWVTKQAQTRQVQLEQH